MIIYPAVDIKDGKCVRLSQGDYDKETIYYDSPLKVAKDFEKNGATHLHVVDLDAALSGRMENFEIIKKIIEQTDMKIEVGGGIRDEASARAYISAGADIISIGTKAVTDKDFRENMINTFPEKISLSLDIRDGYIYIKGWSENSGILIWDFLENIEKLPIASIVVTDISRDGMLLGPNFELYQKLKEYTSHNIVVSGGISSKNDIDRLKEQDAYAVIVGKAIYENKFNLKDIL